VARLVVVGHGYWREMEHTVVYGGIAMHDGDSLFVVAHRGDLVMLCWRDVSGINWCSQWLALLLSSVDADAD
jgi:hypothetical protein